MSVLIRQTAAASLEEVAAQLRDAFTACRAAVEAEEPIVLIAFAPDLLGQGSIEDASVACGFLGLTRALAFEGGSKGWHINLIAVDRDSEPDADLLTAATAIASLNGQVLNASAGLAGKVIP